jgi:hypothetical protein
MRHAWEISEDSSFREMLVMYNAEDRESFLLALSEATPSDAQIVAAFSGVFGRHLLLRIMADQPVLFEVPRRLEVFGLTGSLLETLNAEI